jgi:hypothetical protein
MALNVKQMATVPGNQRFTMMAEFAVRRDAVRLAPSGVF